MWRQFWLAIMVLLAWCQPVHAQIQVDTSYSSQELIHDVLLGKRVEVKNVRYVGSKLAVAAFHDTSVVPLIPDGIILCTGKVLEARGPNRRANASYSLGTRGDHALQALGRDVTFDAASIEFDFVPEMETVVFNFVFGSEEYTEYVNSQFNDVFGFFISGPGYKGVKNLAVVPQKNAPITVNSVNHIYNRSNYLDNNPYDRLGTLKKERLPYLDPVLMRTFEYDGFTTLLRAEARVYPGQTYHIKIAIADVADARYDSAVMLEAGSFTSLPQDPAQRLKLLAEEYGDRKRKFEPVAVGQDPTVKRVPPVDPVLPTVDPLPDAGGKEDVDTYTGPRLFVYFDFDADVLDAAAVARLDSAWKKLLYKPGLKVQVLGHTDGQGGESYNDRLSERRAEAVAAYLRGKGMPDTRLRVAAYGYHQPAQTNATEVGRAKNRRVELRWE